MSGKYALLIGASAFGKSGPPALAAPESDVAALQAVLADRAIAGFAPGDVKFALNSGLEATQELIQWLLHERDRDDLLLLYYTGHGFKDPRDGELYLALAGTRERTPSANSLLASWVKREIGFSASERKLVILDCCHSGAFGPIDAAIKGTGEPAVERDTFSPSGYGSITLASSSAAQPSFEAGGESVYTRMLVDALKTGAADPEAEEVSAQALHAYLSRHVTEESRRRGGLMEPVIYAAEKSRLVIARNPNPRRPLDKGLIDDLWGDDAKLAELAAVKLGELAAGTDRRHAADARLELANRLKSTETLNYAVGRRIEQILSPRPEATAGDAERKIGELEAALKNARASAQEVDDLRGKNAQLSVEIEAPQQPREGPGPKARQAAEEAPRSASDVIVLAPGVDPSRVPHGAVFREIDAPWCPEMVVIPACPDGFLMGSPEDEPERNDDEGPQHAVRIGTRFALARYALTFDEYDAFCAETGREKPSDNSWGRGRRPVINVSWEDAEAYLGWLSGQVGRDVYRLPSEAEWEYACRGDASGRNATPFSPEFANGQGQGGRFITAEEANFRASVTYNGSPKGEDRELTVAVDHPEFLPNGFGLWQMHGNVGEWTADFWHESYDGAPADGTAWLAEHGGGLSRRVVRGGSWNDYPLFLRSAYRDSAGPGGRGFSFGFRPARTLTP